MSLANTTDPVREETPTSESTFGDILTQFEQEHKSAPSQTLQGTVISVGPEHIVIDIGRKMEGVLPVDRFQELTGRSEVKAGDVLPVMVTGRNEEGYYELSTLKMKRVIDWTGLEAAFAQKTIIAGRVLEIVKGGLRVDVGVRAFLPASRSGAKDPAEMEKLVGQEVRCRITKLDTEGEDVVVDRRSIIEEEQAQAKEAAFGSVAEGQVMHGTVRTVTEYGAFVDLGGVDGLLHIADMSWNRVGKASDIVSVGDSVEVKVLKVDPANRRISLGMKQLQPDPWTLATATLKPGDRVQGKVVRIAAFGAFVEIAPGVDGLIHLSSLAWGKRVKKVTDVVNTGDMVDAVVIDVKPVEKRISLSLKEALGDPWEDAEKKFPVGMILEELTVTNLAKFGAFVDLGNGLEGMIHIADITRDKRLEHPKDVLAVGKKVRAIILEVDREKHRVRLGMKQLEPTVLDEFLAAHQVGEVFTARVISVEGGTAKVELSEGVVGLYRIPKPEAPKAPAPSATATEPPPATSAAADLSSLTAKLAQRWKTGPALKQKVFDAPRLRSGEVHPFKIISIDPTSKKIEVNLED